jgi:uncharacterized membrane protein
MDALQANALMAATITMGIGAGVYLLYSFAIMPGLARTDDRTFVGAFQQIDTAIVGPFLLVFFFGPLGFAALAAALHLGDSDRSILGLIATALLIQLVMAAITLRVNVPLNDDIKAAGDPDAISDFAAVRHRFNEARWTRWNAVRAGAATVAFGFLAGALVLQGGAV